MRRSLCADHVCRTSSQSADTSSTAADTSVASDAPRPFGGRTLRTAAGPPVEMSACLLQLEGVLPPASPPSGVSILRNRAAGTGMSPRCSAVANSMDPTPTAERVKHVSFGKLQDEEEAEPRKPEPPRVLISLSAEKSEGRASAATPPPPKDQVEDREEAPVADSHSLSPSRSVSQEPTGVSAAASSPSSAPRGGGQSGRRALDGAGGNPDDVPSAPALLEPVSSTVRSRRPPAVPCTGPQMAPDDAYLRFCARLEEMLSPEVKTALQQHLLPRGGDRSLAAAEQAGELQRRQERQEDALGAALADIEALQQWRAAQDEEAVQRSLQTRRLRGELSAAMARVGELEASNAALHTAVRSLTAHGEAMVAAHQELIADVQEQWAALRQLVGSSLDRTEALWGELEDRGGIVEARLAALEAACVASAARGAPATAMDLRPVDVPVERREAAANAAHSRLSRSGLLASSSASAIKFAGSTAAPVIFDPSPPPSDHSAPPHRESTPAPPQFFPPCDAAPKFFSDIGLIHTSPESQAPPQCQHPQLYELPASPPVVWDTSSRSAPPSAADLFARPPSVTVRPLPGQPRTATDQLMDRLRGPPTVVILHSQWPTGGNLNRCASVHHQGQN